jgi:hypothetical protein
MTYMIGETISHYAPEAHPPVVDKVMEKLGEGEMGVVYKVPKSPTSVFYEWS